MPLGADTTALRYLIEIEAVHLLPAMFAHVIIPPEVAAELQRPKTPVQVRSWMASPPSWLMILQPTRPPDPTLRQLHKARCIGSDAGSSNAGSQVRLWILRHPSRKAKSS